MNYGSPLDTSLTTWIIPYEISYIYMIYMITSEISLI